MLIIISLVAGVAIGIYAESRYASKVTELENKVRDEIAAIKKHLGL